MNEPRDVAVICEQIIQLIPSTEVELINRLNKFSEDLVHHAPEIRKSGEKWRYFGYILSKNICKMLFKKR